MRLFSLYRRWRHSRGYGVHSPFAYRIVKEVVAPTSGYTYYDELMPGMSPMKRLDYRFDIFAQSEKLALPIKDFDAWTANPSAPLFLLNPSPEQLRKAEELLEPEGKGLILYSPRFMIAVARKEMALVRYDLL